MGGVAFLAAYIEPIKTALLIFPFLALAISTIFFVYEYRKYGSFLVFRGVVLYSFVFYLLCAYLLVILPLPSREAVAQLTGPSMELSLGASLRHFMEQTVLNIKDPSTYLPAMKQSVFLEPAFNILILIPFGVFLRYLTKLRWYQIVLASFCLSLFFELTQLTGLYFIYPRSYRLFDVNDLLHNTLGGLIGFWLEPLLTFLLPSNEKLAETAYQRGKEVTLVRRLVAFGLDWLFLGGVDILVTLGITIGTGQRTEITNTFWWYLLEVFLYFVCIPWLTNGKTLGKAIVKIQVAGVGRKRIRFTALLKRYGILYFFYGGYSHIFQGIAPFLKSENPYLIFISTGLVVFGFLITGVFFLVMVWSFLRRKRQLFYENASKTYVFSTVVPK